MTTQNPALRRREGIVYLIAFCLCIPGANWLINNWGTICPPNSPCLIPVAPNFNGGMVMAPSAVLMIGLALVLRDMVQRRLGINWALFAIIVGAGLSFMIAPPALVIASTAAFLLSELADLAIYTPLQKRGLVLAVIASSLVGLVVDSAIFLQLAFGSLDFLAGQVIGKAWMVIFAIPFIMAIRRRDERIGLEAA